jgi:hypothetical protein
MALCLSQLRVRVFAGLSDGYNSFFSKRTRQVDRQQATTKCCSNDSWQLRAAASGKVETHLANVDGDAFAHVVI